MEKEGMEALKIGLKKKYQKDGKGKKGIFVFVAYNFVITVVI